MCGSSQRSLKPPGGAFSDMIRAAPAALELCAERTGDGTILQAPKFDVLILNRAFGIGIESPWSEIEVRGGRPISASFVVTTRSRRPQRTGEGADRAQAAARRGDCAHCLSSSASSAHPRRPPDGFSCHLSRHGKDASS